MYNYSIYPKNDKYTVEVFSQVNRTSYTVGRRIEAIRVIQLIGLELTPQDWRLIQGLDVDLGWGFIGRLVDDNHKLDSEFTCTVNINELGLAQ